MAIERTKITDYEDYRISNMYVRFLEGGVLGKEEPLGCVGSLEMKPDTKAITKECGGRILKQIVSTQSIEMTLEAHLNPNTAIEVLGLTNEGLKPGVYGYNGRVTPKGNIVCSVFDMYNEIEKLIAVPNVTFDGGLSMTISSGEDKVAQIKVPMTALADENGFFYYQVFVKDLTDPKLADSWKTEFDSKLVTKTPGVIGA